MAIVGSMGPGSTGSTPGTPTSGMPQNHIGIVRTSMNPQRISGPQTIMLARPGQPGSVVSMQGIGRPQTAVNNTMMSNPAGIRVQPPGIVNRPATTQLPQGAGQSIVINQPGLRPGQPGSQITVPLQTLQNLRPGQGIPTGQAGHLLVKTETGQYQILRVGTTLTSSVPSLVPTGVSSVTAASLPAHSVPPTSISVRPTMSTSISSNSISLPQRPAAPTMTSAPQTPPSSVPRPPVTTATGGGGGSSAGGMGTQMTPDTAKLKCKNFLATLLRLAGEQPAGVAANVRNLIQGLINGNVEPEVFTTKLQKELNSSPQPCLVPFLKKSLPYLQQSLLTGELTIDGVHPPPPNSPASRMIQQQQAVKVQVMGSPSVSLPQRPTVVMGTVRSSLAPGMRPPSTISSSPSMSNSAVAAAISQLRPTSLPVSTIRPMTPHLSKPSLPTTRSGYGTIQHPVNTTTVKSVSSTFASFAASIPPPVMGSGAVKEKKTLSIGSSYSGTGDEDINDVATMGGVNLAEESQRMQVGLNIGTQIRSCKDETFLQTGLLQQRIARICREKGLDEPPPDVVALISHATQERLKTLLEKLDVIAEHRLDIVKSEGDYEVTQDVRGQIKFLGDLEKVERKRHEEAERELLLRAAKSRTKTEDPEKEKLKAKAKEMQRLEEEQLRHEKANNTALMAIGMPKKKMRLDETLGASLGAKTLTNRPRTKRVHLRDLMFLMEQEKDLKRSPLLWKAYSS